jgi:aspartyl-tRNA(Asn)/glutamyl-tRNA(Gln) amidotransferase subunit A
MGAEVKRRMITGTFALSSGYYDAYYRKALQVRQCIIGQFEASVDSCCIGNNFW